MLHIATVHYREKKWIDIQYKYLRKYVKEPFKLWIASYDIDDYNFQHAYKIFRNIDKSHARQLDFIAQKILETADDDDHLIFLDSDAFFVNDVECIDELLQDKKLAAIQRCENNGDPQPHPCFCLTTVGFWREINGTWRYGDRTWTGMNGIKRNDVGGELYFKLQNSEIDWYKMHRTNEHVYHEVWFGVYDDIIYHHGAGSRRFRCVTDFNEMPVMFKILRRTGIYDITKDDIISKMMLNRYEKLLEKKSEELNMISQNIIQDINNDIDFTNRLDRKK